MSTPVNNFKIETTFIGNGVYRKPEEESPTDQISVLTKHICELNETNSKLVEANLKLSEKMCILTNAIDQLYQRQKTSRIPSPPPLPLPPFSTNKHAEENLKKSSTTLKASTRLEEGKTTALLEATEEFKKILNNENPITDPTTILKSIQARNTSLRRTQSLYRITTINTNPTLEKENLNVETHSLSSQIEHSEEELTIQAPSINNPCNTNESRERNEQFIATKKLFEARFGVQKP